MRVSESATTTKVLSDSFNSKYNHTLLSQPVTFAESTFRAGGKAGNCLPHSIMWRYLSCHDGASIIVCLSIVYLLFMSLV